jgi:hypothetical protein
MDPPKFCPDCGTAWFNIAAYKKCCSCGWKLSAGQKKKEEPRVPRRHPDDSDDGLEILNSNDQWLKEAIKKKNIDASDKATFATRMSRAVRNEKANEEVRAEAKLQRQKKVVKDRAVKTDRHEGVQGGFGHDPRNAPAFFQWREVEIWFMEEGVQMYKFHNSSRTEKFILNDSLPDINKFVREYVRMYDKWRTKSPRDIVEDFSQNEYIAHQFGNSTPSEIHFACSATTTWADFLKELDSIKVKKDKPKLILAFPIKAVEPEPPKKSTLCIPRPNNKWSRSRLLGSDESGEEGVKPLCVKSESQEAGMADDPENGDSDSSSVRGMVVKPDGSGDNLSDVPDEVETDEAETDEAETDEAETEVDSPPPIGKSGRKRGLSGRFQ